MGKDTELRDVQLLNVPSGRISKPSPITTLVSEEQLLNTFEPKDTCAGIIISFKAVQSLYLQPIITQYFIDNKSEIWLLFLIAHSKR